MNDLNDTQSSPENIVISQSVAILIDGNNIERSIHGCLLYTSPSPRD